MSMDEARFEALVERMERLQKRSPSTYKARVLALAALGYGYLVFVVVVLLALTVTSLALIRFSAVLGGKIVLIVGALLLVVLKSLWVRLEPPTGERLTRRDSPELFAMLDRLRARLKTPRVHEVLITPDFNAGVTQNPRLGLFGWHRNYLLIGLPLMKSLTVRQFEAVLAHELGHLSRGHARTGNWIYRLRIVWLRLEHALGEHGGWGSGLIRRFFRWYIPYFSAYSFPFARANEFDADASSVQLTSARDAGQALTNVSVMASYLSERYWPGIHATAKHSAQPAFAPYTELKAGALQRLEPGDTQRWLTQALSERTSHSDTHPSLKDRLAAMGVSAELALPAAGDSADKLLGAHSATLESGFDTQWRNRVQGAWQQFYEQSQKNRERLAELQARAKQGPLEVELSIELANLEEQVGAGAVPALAMRRLLVALEPKSVPARYALGRQLLEMGESEGVALMESAMAEEAQAVAPGCEILRNYWFKLGDHERAKAWHSRLVERAQMEREDQIERNQLRLTDSFGQHELDPAALEALLAQLRKIDGLRRVYLVRKATTHFHERPLYAVGFTVGLAGFFSRARAHQIKHQVASETRWPGETLIIGLSGNNRTFARKFRRVRGSRVFG